jgi:hypothetical protein
MKMKKTILYYPTISIPNNSWLRKAILYWDEIGSIVPQRYYDSSLIPYSPEIQYLKDEGEFRPFRPDALAQRSYKQIQEFENELVDIVLSTEFQQLKDRKQLLYHSKSDEKQFMYIHYDKVSHTVFEFLQDAGLAREIPDEDDWYEFEKTTAFLYMALLAKYLADDDHQATIPGTTLRIYQKFNFQAKSNENSFWGLNIRFLNALPIPRNDISFHDILHFKRRRRDQLLNFRQLLDSFQNSLSNCESQTHANELIARFTNNLEKGLSDLEAVLKDSSIATVAGSFETLLKSTFPGWLATAVVASGKVKSIAEVPISWTVGGTMIAGAIGLSKYLVDKRNERRAALRNSPFSYILSGERDNIIPS